jgi:hypothetical protein
VSLVEPPVVSVGDGDGEVDGADWVCDWVGDGAAVVVSGSATTEGDADAVGAGAAVVVVGVGDGVVATEPPLRQPLPLHDFFGGGAAPASATNAAETPATATTPMISAAPTLFSRRSRRGRIVTADMGSPRDREPFRRRFS